MASKRGLACLSSPSYFSSLTSLLYIWGVCSLTRIHVVGGHYHRVIIQSDDIWLGIDNSYMGILSIYLYGFVYDVIWANTNTLQLSNINGHGLTKELHTFNKYRRHSFSGSFSSLLRSSGHFTSDNGHLFSILEHTDKWPFNYKW